MDRTCENCSHLSNHDTELSLCRLHRRYTEMEWTCNDFEHVIKTNAARYESEQAEDSEEVR